MPVEFQNVLYNTSNNIRDLVYDRLSRVNIHTVRTIYSHFQIGSKFDQYNCPGLEVAVCLRLEQHICLFFGKV